MATNGMTIDSLNIVSSLTAQDEVPVWDKEASGEPTRKITAQNMANSVKTLGNLVNTTEMNTAIAQSTAYSTGEPMVVPTGLAAESFRWERIGDVVTFTCSLTSESSSDSTSINNGETIISGLPVPRITKIFLGHTFISGDRAYRMKLNTDGTITAYWDTVVVPRNGSTLVINFTYIA